MNIGVIGLGKLGCSMFAAFASSGNKVFGYDINEYSRNNLRKKKAPVLETDLDKDRLKGMMRGLYNEDQDLEI